jgi:hypothetical protein
MLVKDKNKRKDCIEDHRRQSGPSSPIDWGRRGSATCQGGVLKVFSSTPKYVTLGELCHRILAILRGEC